MRAFRDRFDAGRQLAETLRGRPRPGVVVGLARGGMQVAAEVARALDAELDVVAVRKVGHPWQPEYAIGAVVPGGGGYVRGRNGLTPEEAARAVDRARSEAESLDRRLHATHPPAELRGKDVLLVDDGLATGATMIAAARWARDAGARRVAAAVPVAAAETAALVRREVDELTCPNELAAFGAVGFWYEEFPQVDDAEVLRLLDEARPARSEAS